jgi:nucleotide-binding universal stress UspA family protein
MDYTKLKNRPSWPFETIGVAVAFSPRMEKILAEAQILATKFNAQLILLHVGERTRDKENKLAELMTKNGIDEKKTRVVWNEGEPVETILHLCKLHIVDLLVLGALEKENMLQFYLGTIARKIARRAKCSVLMLTEPSTSGSRFRKMVVNVAESPKTMHTFNTAIYFAKHMKSREIIAVTETHQPGLAMTIADDNTAGEVSKIRKEIRESIHEKMNELLDTCEDGKGIEISDKQVSGKPGYAIRAFAESKKADLLVINSPDVKLGIMDRIFTHGMEFILEDLPCNLLIVHSRVTN